MKLSLLPIISVLFVLTLILTSLPYGANAQSDCNPNICKVTINRTVSVTNWGVTIAKDNFNLNSTSPVSHATVGIPGIVGAHLKYATATDSSTKTSLQVTNLGVKTCNLICSGPGNYTSLEVTFPGMKTGQYSFNLTTVYTGLLTYNQTTFRTVINPYPMNDNTMNVTSASFIIDRNDWPSPRILPGNQTLTGQSITTNNWKPFNNTVWTIQFSSTGTSQAILDTMASRLITINSNGSIIVTDNYNITNHGPPVSSILFTLPKSVNGVTVADTIGPLTSPTTSTSPNGTTILTFVPRYGQVPTNQSTRVQITYTLAKQNYVTMSGVAQYTLNYRTFDSAKFYQPTLTTVIQVPPGFTLKSLNGQSYQITGDKIMIQNTPLTPVTNTGFGLTYRLDPFWSSVTPLGWTILLEAAIAGVTIVTLSTRRAVPAGVLVGPPQVINRFVELYDEKSSMRLESDKIEEDVARGAMNRFDYRRRRRTIDVRMNEIDRALVPVKEQLSAISPRYQDMIRRLERAEAELRAVRTTSIDIRNQYRSGRMSRELYDSLNNDLIRRRDRAQQSIDNVIISLREEIR